ncbi:hypothetical protein [Ferrimonas sediminum]|nr:hypothetical protein [Ferrimonas sediminum]
MMKRPNFMVALLLMLVSGACQAHLLKVFAYVEGEALHGNAYFAGGGPATGARIELHNSKGEPVATLAPDANGEFTQLSLPVEVTEVVAVIGDGHQARWPLQRSAAPALPAPQPVTPVNEALDADALAKLVEQAVARQVGPLRQELQASEARARLSDIVGGLGMIFGIAFGLMWWRGRR